MYRQALRQKNQLRLSPRQVQLSQLLQISTPRLAERIAEELMENPALEEEKSPSESDTLIKEEETWEAGRGSGSSGFSQKASDREQETSLQAHPSWYERLASQLMPLSLNETELDIARYLLGSLDADGYLRKNLTVIAEEIAYLFYVEVEASEAERILQLLQHHLTPAGVGARSLQECWLLQLERTKDILQKSGKNPAPPPPGQAGENTSATPPGKPSEVHILAIQVVRHCFDWLASHQYDRIISHLGLTDREQLRQVLHLLSTLKPLPLNTKGGQELPGDHPPADFIVTEEADRFKVALAGEKLPRLRVQKKYRQMLHRYQKDSSQKGQEMTSFLRQRIERAHWFVEAIQQRQRTLKKVMEAIVSLQRPFFESQDEKALRPLYLRHVAEAIGMDLSTVSRAVKGKRVETPFGTYPLRYFFSEPIATESGEEVSSRLVKEQLRQLVANEDKQHPYTDEQLMLAFRKQGIPLARRTIAKYRQQLGIPVARLRTQA